MRNLLVLTLLFTSFNLLAQTGTIRGRVMDEVTGESMIGVNVVVEGTTSGAVTDLDGYFSIVIAPGTYTVNISFISYTTVKVEKLEVKEGEITQAGTIVMKEDQGLLTTVVITGEASRKSEEALLKMKQKSTKMLDGIGGKQMGLIGDSDAGGAVKRVTGVSVEGGKYVIVRGLGDRYTKTTMNGFEIPGLDPDKNSLQLDIFPTNLIENLMVSKNFSADLPADFTGGLLNIETKAFPEDKFITLSASVTYNPNMHFNKNYLDYKGSGTDWLGFDSGARKLPTGADSPNMPSPLSGASNQTVNNFVSSFNSTLGAERKVSPMDFSVGFSMGDQIELKSKNEGDPVRNLGYIFSFSYKANFKYYNDVFYGEYQKRTGADEFEMIDATTQQGELGERNILIGLLGGLAYKTQSSKYRFTLMHLQNSESKAGKFDILNNSNAAGQSGYVAYSDNLSYNQRSLTNLLVHGKHTMKENKWEVEWGVSPTLSISKDPDIRKTAWTVSPGVTNFQPGAGGNPSRIWRDLMEINAHAKGDATFKYQIKKRDANLKFGASYIFKNRDYRILFFDMQFWNPQVWSANPTADEVLHPDNIFPNNPNGIYYASGNSTPNPNEYQSSVHNTGLYVRNDMTLAKNFKLIIGVRGEYYLQLHTGRDQAWASGNTVSGNNLVNAKVINSIDVFPEVNMIYTHGKKENMNLRASYSMSIARPSFKEMSYAQILDPITNRIFNGGFFQYADWDGNLVETRIHNVDLRWELFMEPGEIFSISGFYKNFDKPIELVRIPEQVTSTEYQPRNVGQAWLAGVEVEIRKDLGFISEKIKGLGISANVTLVKSEVIMTDAEYNNRLAFQKNGEHVINKRAMAGQSPWVVNAGITYSNRKVGIDCGIFYNVKGPTLFIVGSGMFPDIYADPFHSLNFSFNIKVGKEKKTTLEFQAQNLIGDNIYQYYKSYGAANRTFTSMSPWRTFSFGFKHNF